MYKSEKNELKSNTWRARLQISPFITDFQRHGIHDTLRQNRGEQTARK
jgi:hypothetical protein